MPVFGVRARARARHLRRLHAARRRRRAASSLVDDFEMPNGLCFSPDESILYINDTDRMHIRKFSVDADGSLSGGDVWFTEEGTRRASRTASPTA